MKISSLLLFILSFIALQATNDVLKIKGSSIFSPSSLGKISMYRDEDGFSIKHNDKKIAIPHYDVDPLLKKANTQQLRNFLKDNYIAVNKMDNGDYSLKAKVRGNGGGYLTGLAGAWVVRTLCYGTAAAAIGTIAVTTAGVGVAAVTGTLATATGALVVPATTGMVTVATAGGAGAGITAAGLTGEAIAASAGAISAFGGVSGAVAAVETAAVTTQVALTLIPWLP